ncbi:MAG: metal ABC transporter ATP-binding protein [Candidatus Altiarchaeota archaeon]|nr:metal ABC transporter ATP-binding protein [Candidatus Altiarchaeota archaeon]
MEKEVLNVKNLYVELEGEEIIKNLTFNVMEREVLIILGPNGAGKTTLLRALLGLLPYRGEISWSTKDISYLPPKELFYRKDPSPLSIKDFFKFKNVSSEKITEIMESVGLDSSLLKKRFDALSTGQFQRMIIAWALVDEPSVLLFDEPTSGIDIGGQETIYSLLHKFWKERNLTILLVTHDLNVVWEHGNNVLCLNKKMLCYGRPNEVLTPEGLEELYGTGVKFYEHKHD